MVAQRGGIIWLYYLFTARTTRLAHELALMDTIDDCTRTIKATQILIMNALPII